MSGSTKEYGTGISAAQSESLSPVAYPSCVLSSRCALCSLSWHLFDRPPDSSLAAGVVSTEVKDPLCAWAEGQKRKDHVSQREQAG